MTKHFPDSSHLSDIDCQSAGYVEGLLADYLREPASVTPIWREYFAEANRDLAGHRVVEGNGHRRGPSFSRFSVFNPPRPFVSEGGGTLLPAEIQARVDQLVRAYRVRGHLAARIDPLGLRGQRPEELRPEAYGIQSAFLGQTCSSVDVGGPDSQTLRSVIERLERTYCRFIGVQFMHIDDPHVRDWLSKRMEATENRPELSRDEQLRILTRLTDAVTFEEFVRKKYVGAKTFSLEGAETLIPLLDLAIEKAGRWGTKEIVIGMAHRGRLNVLANIVGKSPQEIFWEFEDPHPKRHRGRGDVKYHLGYSGDWKTAAGKQIHLSLCFNPSHLEFVDPVAVGRVRAKQDRAGDQERRQCMGLLIHGDAGFAGEGIVQETLNLSELAGYRIGGTLHIVVNNQLGFTTSPAEGRSTTYATDIAKMLRVPIFHVNGEHPEAVAQVVDLAMEFRARYASDVVIDMYCYRRWGHNEADDPSFTQPRMYRAIEKRPSIRDSYLDHLLTLEGVTREEADEIARQRHTRLRAEFDAARETKFSPLTQTLGGHWREYLGGYEPAEEPDTGIPVGQLRHLLVKLTESPDGFHVHPRLKRSIESRRRMAEGKQPLDWSAAEALALATLAVEGHPIRLSGQDTVRGTFSQRHAILYDKRDGHAYSALRHLSPEQARVEIINSPLCEAATLGFEYGYSMDYPEALIVWEAQFGDFWNAAQVIVDQFLASAEDKWQRLSGIVLLLPHGFEGQGPEHSSARWERFLTLAAEDNLQIVCPSTPAQYFHCLRRQVKRRWRKPLIVFTPKSLLRHHDVVSPLEDFARGGFRRILPDALRPRESSAERLLLCSGKIYYELSAARKEKNRQDVSIVRIEQFYPLNDQALGAVMPFDSHTPVYWVQEEPENMGAYPYWRFRFGDRFLGRHPLRGITRAMSASPATGSKAAHKEEQAELIRRAFESET